MVKKYKSLRDMIKIVNKAIDTDVYVPCSDTEAWIKYPDYRHVYNKLWIAESQNMSCGPMGIYPNEYPVIFKPIINLYGMSRGTYIVYNDTMYDKCIKDGLFWEDYLNGIHRCIDIVLRDGQIYFLSCLESIKGNITGTFEYHVSIPDYNLPIKLKEWINLIFDGYTGLVNLETINDLIIECHLRFNGDAQLYNFDFVTQLINFLDGKTDDINYDIEKKYLIPIFVKKEFELDLELYYDKISKLCDEFDANTIGYDDPKSINQSEHMSRLLILDISDLNKGIILKKKLSKLFDIDE